MHKNGISDYLLFYLMFQGLCHISELSASWLAKAEDVSILGLGTPCKHVIHFHTLTFLSSNTQAVKAGDRIDVKLIEVCIIFPFLPLAQLTFYLLL